MSDDYSQLTPEQRSIVGRVMGWCLTNKLIVGILVVLMMAWGLYVAPFDWNTGSLERSPVATDAIPDIGENQQIVFTAWPGRTPQDVEDQITYPLTAALMGIPEVKTIRSSSMFGFSSIYIIFKESAEFYWTRSRVLEKLNSLTAGTLPEGVRPQLGPDATALGQVFWYTLEGRDEHDNPAGGWDLEELRTVQDWQVRYHLLSADGVAEVASVGGFVREYQVDVNPDAMRAAGVTLAEVYHAVASSNVDVGARTLELTGVEYFIRGVGFLKKVSDIENSVVKVVDNVPILVRHVATVTLGPATRRGVLDKDGAEAVGGVVVARFGSNPLAAIKNVKKKIEQIAPALPEKVQIDFSKTTPQAVRDFASQHGFEAYQGAHLDQEAWVGFWRTPGAEHPSWATLSKVTIVPFYDRTGLIYETLGTLEAALTEEILVTFIVVIVMVLHLRSSALIGSMLPLAVLGCFVAMKLFGVDANIVALSGIAIAIGTIVDMGIVLCENMLRHLDEAPPEVPRLQVIHRASAEVGSAVLTAVATTVISFLPVFAMTGAEGKLFRPLAFTKTFALIASIVVALTVIPPAAHIVFCGRISGRGMRRALYGLVALAGVALVGYGAWTTSMMIVLSGAALTAFAAYGILAPHLPDSVRKFGPLAANIVAVVLVGLLLAAHWEPLGPQWLLVGNFLFVAFVVSGFLVFFWLFRWVYPWVLRACLAVKPLFIALMVLIVLSGVWVWQSLGREFMPPLDEGSYLWMPTTMVHASIGEAYDVLARQDRAFAAIPEVDRAVGKIGRAETPLDPAPVSMIETVITYKSEYATDKDGRRINYRYDRDKGEFVRDADGKLIPDESGRPFRQWRPHIHTPEDIWAEITAAGQVPGTTSAPRLQPIAARIVMLQSGMRAPMGIKIKGPDLATIESVGLRIEQFLKDVPGVEPESVFADRIVGKPYLEIIPDREALARYGVPIRKFQDVVEVAIGGMDATTTVEGRDRFAVRIRYARELRDSEEAIRRILVPGTPPTQVPLEQVASVRYARGPQVIKSEDTFLVGYVLFDKLAGEAEVDVVERCKAYLEQKEASGELVRPRGVDWEFSGTYKNELRSRHTLMIMLPLALVLIFLILYLQFKRVSTTLLIFTGIFVAWAGGFLLLGLYGTHWFLQAPWIGDSLRELFNVHTINLSVAVWVGFLALFGIATDDGVVMSTYLEQSFRGREPETIQGVRDATVAAGTRRVRPCLMTTATTILALLPVLTSRGRGSDIMGPMAVPIFGGMCIEVLTMLVVPVFYCLLKERAVKKNRR